MIQLFRNMWQRRELVKVLVAKDFFATYRQSLLGPAWAIIQPLAITFMGVVLRVVFKRSEGMWQSIIFMYSATLAWSFFGGALKAGTGAVVANASILKKVYFPREIFVAVMVTMSLINFLIASCGLVVIMVFSGTAPTPNLLYIPLLLLITYLLAMGLSLFTSAIAVFKRDVIPAMTFLLSLWMFCSPVFYEMGDVPERLRTLFKLNPMTGIITAFRQVILYGGAPGFRTTAYAAAISITAVILGYAFFKKLEIRFADVI